jgi:hypothetical protein
MRSTTRRCASSKPTRGVRSNGPRPRTPPHCIPRLIEHPISTVGTGTRTSPSAFDAALRRYRGACQPPSSPYPWHPAPLIGIRRSGVLPWHCAKLGTVPSVTYMAHQRALIRPEHASVYHPERDSARIELTSHSHCTCTFERILTCPHGVLGDDYKFWYGRQRTRVI